jgi:hypothetical protein
VWFLNLQRGKIAWNQEAGAGATAVSNGLALQPEHTSRRAKPPIENFYTGENLKDRMRAIRK